MNTTINYDIRSKFYDNEVKENEDINKFISTLTTLYDIKSAVNCPCGSGCYLNVFSNTFEKSYFCDLEKAMIGKVNEKIIDRNYSNVEGLVLDIMDLDKSNSDAIIMLNQGLQYVPLSNFRDLLKKLKAKYLILDLFDFRKEGKLTYFDSSVVSGDFYLSKSFDIDGNIINRYNKHVISNDRCEFEYLYDFLDCRTTFTLFNYGYDEFTRVVEKSNYKIKDIYGDYDFSIYNDKGHYIVVLERN